MTTFRNVATPQAPIAILLLHLQALCNVIVLTFVIVISLFPRGAYMGGGRRRRKCRSQRGRWPRRRLYYYAKAGSRNRGLVAERLTDVNHGLCEVKSGTSSGALPNDRLNDRFKRATVVAATNYKMGDTKKRID